MQKEISQDKAMQDYMTSRKIAISFGAVVYLGVVLLATALFISYVLSAFPEDAYLSRLIMTIGGAMVGGSMVAFPVALEKWCIQGVHRTAAVVLYYLEIAIIAANTFVSFYVLMSVAKGWIVPEWLAYYEPFTILSLLYTLFAWGTLFILDPMRKITTQKLSAVQQREEMIAAKVLEFLNTEDGEEEIMKHVIPQLSEMLNTRKYQPKRFGAARSKDTFQMAQEVNLDRFRSPAAEKNGLNGQH